MSDQPKSAEDLARESRKYRVAALREDGWNWFAYHAAQDKLQSQVAALQAQIAVANRRADGHP